MSFLDILVNTKVITRDDVEYIQKEAEDSGKGVEEILRDRGISPQVIIKAKGEFMHLPTRIVTGVDVGSEVLKYIPEESAEHYKIVPIAVKDGTLEVGIVDPDNIEARDALNFISSKANLPYKIFLITEEGFQGIFNQYKGIMGEVGHALDALESEFAAADVQITRENSDEISVKPGTANIVEDAPVTKIVATILRYAIEGGASDVHIEPLREKVQVRFRIDGVLNTSLVLPKKVHEAVNARIKILSDMKLDEKRKPQDGRFSARIDDRKIDFRVSTFPTYYGEKVVMRILDQAKGVQKLDQMGLSKRDMDLIRDAINRPYGLILISGPTGSGKTTTLYSMLNEIDRAELNVLSLEDPVEYNIEGMSQSQVHPEIGYTFATGLRTTLRQDPDVIMVGEIRDKETAQLAIQAALTGHLVLSTIHTNSAVGIIPRLVDMGVDPYLIAPTLVLGIAQRLVGKAHVPAVEEVPVDDSLKVLFDKQFKDLPEEYKKNIPEYKTVYRIKPIPECPKGTRGRQAVFEMYKVDKELQKIILSNPTEPAVNEYVRKQGMLTMKEDAMIRALRKEIPYEEVNKV